MRSSLLTVATACATCVGLVDATAQVLGTFPWQLQPYCNVITLTLTSGPSGFALNGVDDQCGAINKASAVGSASFNANGQVTLTFTVVTAPSATPVHVAAVVAPTTGQGTWSDSAGNSGVFAFFGNSPGLPRRPVPAGGLGPGTVTTVEIAAGAVGLSDIDVTQVQARVTGTCPAGASLSGIGADGTVVCGALNHAGPLRRVVFPVTAVPSTATSLAGAATLATVTFTSPVTGTAILSGRGQCLYNGGATNSQGQIGWTVPGETFFPVFQEVVTVAALANSSVQFEKFNPERAIAVTTGTTYTVALKAFHSSGIANQFNCSGTSSLRLHVGSIP